jgi:hypothetical protein
VPFYNSTDLTLTAGAPLQVSGGPRATPTTSILPAPAQLELVIQEASQQWTVALPGPNTAAALGQVQFRFADLAAGFLGLASGNTVWIDTDAAGYGWFVDPTPGDDAEFTPGTTETDLLALKNGPANGKVDLLTVIAHELGHVLGFDHAGTWNELMSESLAPSVRHREILPPTSWRSVFEGGESLGAQVIAEIDQLFAEADWLKIVTG